MWQWRHMILFFLFRFDCTLHSGSFCGFYAKALSLVPIFNVRANRSVQILFWLSFLDCTLLFGYFVMLETLVASLTSIIKIWARRCVPVPLVLHDWALQISCFVVLDAWVIHFIFEDRPGLSESVHLLSFSNPLFFDICIGKGLLWTAFMMCRVKKHHGTRYLASHFVSLCCCLIGRVRSKTHFCLPVDGRAL